MIVRYVLLGLLLCLPSVALAQNHFPLEIIKPLPSGSAGSGFDPDNRIYRAYQGIPYTIKAEGIGGRWPYTYSLSGQPTGMTIEAGPCTTIGPTCTAGTITWTNPQSSDASITVRVTDGDGDWVEATWGVTVSTTIGADGFCFINADSGNDTTGNGSLATPWQTYGKAKTTCGARSILYFRGATASYTFSGLTPTAEEACGVNGKIRQTESTGPVIFIGYPGETATFDLDTGYTALAPCFELEGENIWISNLTIQDCYRKCFEIGRTGQFGATFWSNRVNRHGPGADSQNSGILMFAYLGSGTQSYFDMVSNNTVSNITAGTGNTCFKQYSVRKGITAYNSFTTIEAQECVAPKMAISQYTIRGNVFSGITGSAIWGNQQNGSSLATPSYGEILFNLVKDGTTSVLQLNQEGTGAESFIYRNTFIGPAPVVWNVDGTHGPFNFVDNVIINAGGSGGSCPQRISCNAVTDYSRIVLLSNLQGAAADSIVDVNGLLVGSYRTNNLGLDGWEFAPIGSALLTGGARIIGTWRAQ